VPTVEVVLDALDAEARKWGEIKPVMDKAKTTVEGIILTPGAFFAGTDLISMILLLPSYNLIKDAVAKLSGGAATEFGQLQEAMVRAKGEYQRVDGASAQVLSKPIFGT
jgi:hypothetical protein